MHPRSFAHAARLAGVAVGLFTFAHTACAQNLTTIDSTTTVGPAPVEAPLRGFEVGLLPTAMHYTADVGTGAAWGGGATLALGYFFNPWLGLEAQGPVTVNPDLNIIAKMAPNSYSATLSAVFVEPQGRVVQPYLAVGGGYDWYYFHRPAFSYYVYRLSSPVAHGSLGLRFRLSRIATLRTEVGVDAGRHRPSEDGLFGVSIFPGVHRTKPQIERTVITRQLLRVDTLHVTDTVQKEVHIHDTVTVSQVQVRTQIDTSVILVLQDVNFAVGQSALVAVAQPVLNRLAAQLNSSALHDVPIEIRGYTDSIGSDSANYKLGLARAQAVANYLVKEGVDAKRLVITSGGKSDPIAPNNTAAGRGRNRRVVIRRAREQPQP